jgi:hypothetical protein
MLELSLLYISKMWSTEVENALKLSASEYSKLDLLQEEVRAFQTQYDEISNILKNNYVS